jgi:hypothetical protein
MRLNCTVNIHYSLLACQLTWLLIPSVHPTSSSTVLKTISEQHFHSAEHGSHFSKTTEILALPSTPGSCGCPGPPPAGGSQRSGGLDDNSLPCARPQRPSPG